MEKQVQKLFGLKDSVLAFLENMKSRTVPGYYRYSYSGDIYGDDIHWNVGSSVFAIKIYYTLGCGSESEINDASGYIKTFRHGGLIYDDLVYRKSFRRNLLLNLRRRQFANIFNVHYKNAETRQCCSAMLLHDELPQDLRVYVPNTEKGVDKYLSELNWSQPWDAGSHFSHLMFFLSMAARQSVLGSDLYNDLVDYAIGWVNGLQNSNDGSWYAENPSLQQRINGAMKIITGLAAVDRVDFRYPEKLIDMCLLAVNDTNACDNFNIIYVLNYAGRMLGRTYRQTDIEKFVLKRLSIYWEHYYDELGGFSFYRKRANDVYYGAKITKGLNEPDMHGTVLFLWGISIVAQLLGIEKELLFKEFKT